MNTPDSLVSFLLKTFKRRTFSGQTLSRYARKYNYMITDDIAVYQKLSKKKALRVNGKILTISPRLDSKDLKRHQRWYTFKPAGKDPTIPF